MHIFLSIFFTAIIIIYNFYRSPARSRISILRGINRQKLIKSVHNNIIFFYKSLWNYVLFLKFACLNAFIILRLKFDNFP